MPINLGYGMGMHEVAVVGAMIYFSVFGSVFVFRPEMIDRLGLTWTNPAGRTEVRCYYGALSWALAIFLGYLLSEDLAAQALTGVLILASAVFIARLVGTLVDGGVWETYNRQALPIEAAFVVVLTVLRVAG
ncbi:MAG: DUF4345 family protein [Microthrixaceae bacterium]